MKPAFLLGIGCQRGGTTWLYEYLAAHPQCAMSVPKELHVFDAALRPDLSERFQNRRRAQLAELTDTAAVPLETHAGPAELIQMTEDLSLYPRYFDRLAATRPDCRVTGEITPAYSALKAEHFRLIRRLMEDAGYAIKVVFLLRDPIARAFSQMRLRDGNWTRWERFGVQAPSAAAHLRFAHACADPEVLLRTRYDWTLAALDAAFEPEQVYIGFHETMFEPANVAALCAFLGIDVQPADAGLIVNQAPVIHPLADADTAVGQQAFDAVYAACRARFGDGFIRSIWRNCP